MAKVLIAADHGGYALKEQLKEKLAEQGYEAADLGCSDENSVDYPDYAAALARQILAGDAAQGILICGTGIGMCITANKFSGIRAALCHDTFSATATREHNDSNVLCLGARVIGRGLAEEVMLAWLKASYTGGRHQRRLDKIKEIEDNGQLTMNS